MKTTILAIIAIVFIAIFYACDQKKAQQTGESAKDTKPNVEANEKEETNDTRPSHEPYYAVGYKKTPCFGKCPVYEVKIYSDNSATWQGKMHVDRMGWHEARLTKVTVNDIKNKASEMGYLDFYDEYPVEHKVADLPSTITYIRYGDMIKSVKNTIEGPKSLKEFEAYLEEVINNLDWKPSERKD